MNYCLEKRLRFIECILRFYGSIGRAELMDYYGIAEAQATRDFAAYKKLAPNNLILNQSSKRWIKTDNFKAIYK